MERKRGKREQRRMERLMDAVNCRFCEVADEEGLSFDEAMRVLEELWAKGRKRFGLEAGAAR